MNPVAGAAGEVDEADEVSAAAKAAAELCGARAEELEVAGITGFHLYWNSLTSKTFVNVPKLSKYTTFRSSFPIKTSNWGTTKACILGFIFVILY